MSGLYVSNTNPICNKCDEKCTYVETVYDSDNASHQLCWNCYIIYLGGRDRAIKDFHG